MARATIIRCGCGRGHASRGGCRAGPHPRRGDGLAVIVGLSQKDRGAQEEAESPRAGTEARGGVRRRRAIGPVLSEMRLPDH